jgi:hypothetical protein
MILDTRYPNSQIVPFAGSMPTLEVIFQHLSEARVFASLDAFQGFWRFILHEESQKYTQCCLTLESLPQTAQSKERPILPMPFKQQC